jgi:hypothetical protein
MTRSPAITPITNNNVAVTVEGGWMSEADWDRAHRKVWAKYQQEMDAADARARVSGGL